MVTRRHRIGQRLLLSSCWRYGNQNACLLSHLSIEYNFLEPRVRWQGSELILEAGQIHAAAENDEYRMQAPWEDDQYYTAPIVCGVKTVNAFTSVLKAINVDTNLSVIQTAWRAIPCTHLPNRCVTVKLSSQLQHDKWQETIAVSKFLERSVGLQKTSSPLTRVHIEITDENEYQI